MKSLTCVENRVADLRVADLENANFYLKTEFTNTKPTLN